MTPKPAESAVERYFIETIHHDRTRYTELNKVPGTTHCLITTADAAINELLAEVERVTKQYDGAIVLIDHWQRRADEAEALRGQS